MTDNAENTTGKSKRGFASMDPELRREICSKGGKASHAMGRAHEFNSETGSKAGKLGGAKVAQDRRYMSELGKKGAAARNRARAADKTARGMEVEDAA